MADRPVGLASGVSCAAPAKINLYLHVTGRRDDGYHLLDSLAVFAGIEDRVTARPASGLSLSVAGPFSALAPVGGGNLVLRAALCLAAATGRSTTGQLMLEKYLPVAAGIGGGSADAAAALKVLNALWETGLSASDLAVLGLELGADLPLCLFGWPAFVGGMGEDIVAAPALPPAWLVLVNPGVPVSTPAVFKARRGAFSVPGRFADAPRDAHGLAELLAARGNDLTPAAIGIAPVIGEVLAALERQPECLLARMSGSGATCFGLFAEEAAARTAAARLAEGASEWWVAAAPVLTTAPVPEAA